MHFALRSILALFALLLLPLLPAPRGALAQTASEPAPFIVVSIAPIDKIFADLETIAASLGAAGATKEMRESAVKTLGVDPAKPMGMWMSAAKETPEEIDLGIFASVSDPKVFESALTLAGYSAAAEQDGVKQYTGSMPGVPSPLFGKLIGSTFFLTATPATMNRLPRDPATLLGDLPSKYLLGMRIQTKDVSPATLAKINQAMAQASTPPPSADPIAARTQAQVGQQIAQFNRMMTELHEFNGGLRIDSPTRSIRGDWDATFKAGTDMAKKFAAIKATKSNVSGLLALGNAFQMLEVNVITPSELEAIRTSGQGVRQMAEQALAQIGPGASVESQNARRAFIDGFSSLMDETFAAGASDMGMAVRAEGKSLTLAAAMSVSDGKKLAQLLRSLAEAEKTNPDFPEVLFDYLSHQNVAIHYAKIPTPDQGNLKKTFGDEIDIAIGTGDKTAWIVVGSSAIDQMKKAIDESALAAAKPVEKASQFKINATPILQFVGAIETREGPLKTIGEAASRFTGEATISSHTSATDTGFKGEMVISEDVFKLVRDVGTALFTSALLGAGS